jgi:hypothetical protein
VTREEKAAPVRALREEGHTWKEIGDMLGISLKYAHGLYSDPTGEKARERKRRYERPCVDCGKTINPNGLGRKTIRCAACHGAHTRAQTRRWIIDSVADWVHRPALAVRNGRAGPLRIVERDAPRARAPATRPVRTRDGPPRRHPP